jgi:UDPglucose 6-dehydrogenase
LQQCKVPFFENLLPELLSKHLERRLRFSTELNGAIRESDAVFIAVGTPSLDNGEADLSYVDAAVREVALAIEKYTVIIEKSTVPVLTCEAIRKAMNMNGARKSMFDVVSNPEFLREGSAVTDFLYPDRIVIGASSQRATDALLNIYAPLLDGTYYKSDDRIAVPEKTAHSPQLIVTSPISAELIKHASNAFLAMKISYANLVANLCEAVGADVEDVCRGLGADSRIGDKFLEPGIGYGGSCFPKDVAAFGAVAREFGYSSSLLDEVEAINTEQRKRFVRKIKDVLWTLRGKKIAALGLAYKGGTDDVRESPAIDVVRLLLNEGCEVRVFDPEAMEKAKQELSSNGVQFAGSMYEAMDGADAAVILTDWRDFAEMDLSKVRQRLRYPILIDGRNLFSHTQAQEAGLNYHSIGRMSSDATNPAEVVESSSLAETA